MRSSLGNDTRKRIGIVGFGLGPIVVALVTDHVLDDPASLKYSPAIVAIVVGPMGPVGSPSIGHWYPDYAIASQYHG
jgi:hypothetical protein